MIEMSCPRCGAGGRIPRDKAGSRMVCKKCLQVFHLGPSHQPVIGEPPAPKNLPKQRVQRERVGLELELGLGGLGDKLSKIKLPDPKIVGVSAAVLLVVGILWWLFSKQTVEQRCQSLATAIRTSNMDTTMALTLPGTEMESIKWLVDVSKRYLDLKLAIGNLDPGMQVQVQENADGSAQALMRFSREGAVSTGPLSVEQAAELNPVSETKKSTMELIVVWSKDVWGNWRLDGKRTIENLNRPE